MNKADPNTWLTHASYCVKLKPLLPDQAFLPNSSTAWILFINLSILVLGWIIANHLDQWNWYLRVFFLPFALFMGNAVVVCLFTTHDLLHGNTIKNPSVRWLLSLVGLTLLWMPPTLWKTLHNQEHHGKTNTIHDPDRSYLFEQPNTWGKWIQNKFTPSSDVHPLFLIIGMGHSWGIYSLRNLTSILLFNDGSPDYLPATFSVSSQKRFMIAIELLLICSLHYFVLLYLGFNPLKILLAYFLPIWIGYAGVISYVYTNHILCAMNTGNDPLRNTVSVRVPRIFDLLHLNFSHHVEHHIFPAINSDYYPFVRELLICEYGDQFKLMPFSKAWELLLKTPRHYLNENTFTDWNGIKSIPCLQGGTL